MQFEWSHGRRLEKASNQSYNVSYKYDDGGIRTSKTVNGVTTEFITSGIQVLVQKTGDNVLVWQVDGNGTTVGFNYNGTQYIYLKNAQGDIVGITDASGNLVAEYVYDSWGKVLHVLDATGTEITDSSNIAKINPLLYRGYYYDSELGLYYLNARYYDPETGRFINADDEDILLDEDNDNYNLLTYCLNNPINMFDDEGSNPAALAAGGLRLGLANAWNPAGVALAAASIAMIRAQHQIELANRARIKAQLDAAMAARNVAKNTNLSKIKTSTSTRATPLNNKNKNPKKDKDTNLKKISNNKEANKIAKKLGYKGAEALKAEFVSQGSKFNMMKNTKTGEIILQAIEGSAQVATKLFV